MAAKTTNPEHADSAAHVAQQLSTGVDTTLKALPPTSSVAARGG